MTDKKTPTILRHGDVYLVQVDDASRAAGLVPADLKPGEGDIVPTDAAYGGPVLAYGEVTGHAHVVRGDRTATVRQARGLVMLELKRAAKIRHLDRSGRVCDHDDVALKGRYYRVIRQTEYVSPTERRQVED